MNRGSLLLAMAYALSALLPAAHTLLESVQRACDGCVAAMADAPAVEAECNGPCGDPAHHHHLPHHKDYCPTCQAGGTPHLLASTSTGSLFTDRATPFDPAALPKLIDAANVRIGEPRAPPLRVSL